MTYRFAHKPFASSHGVDGMFQPDGGSTHGYGFMIDWHKAYPTTIVEAVIDRVDFLSCCFASTYGRYPGTEAIAKLKEAVALMSPDLAPREASLPTSDPNSRP